MAMLSCSVYHMFLHYVHFVAYFLKRYICDHIAGSMLSEEGNLG